MHKEGKFKKNKTLEVGKSTGRDIELNREHQKADHVDIYMSANDLWKYEDEFLKKEKKNNDSK
jgi:uncharacterized protein YneR